jgi:hypothetical protein
MSNNVHRSKNVCLISSLTSETCIRIPRVDSIDFAPHFGGARNSFQFWHFFYIELYKEMRHQMCSFAHFGGVFAHFAHLGGFLHMVRIKVWRFLL